MRTAPGLALRPAAWTFLAELDRQPPMNDSSAVVWGLVDQLPRVEIFNDRLWPYRRWVWGSDGVRKPALVRRNEHAAVHGRRSRSSITATAWCLASSFRWTSRFRATYSTGL